MPPDLESLILLPHVLKEMLLLAQKNLEIAVLNSRKREPLIDMTDPLDITAFLTLIDLFGDLNSLMKLTITRDIDGSAKMLPELNELEFNRADEVAETVLK